MILGKTWYKSHNNELLALVELFKIWKHYLKNCKYKVFVLTDYNNFWQFIDVKILSFCQVCWAQKLSYYYFQINYYQGKANEVADMLSCFF